jgi:hypothetical protein
LKFKDKFICVNIYIYIYIDGVAIGSIFEYHEQVWSLKVFKS